eukprot:TRINITY_DN1600_c0_g1_i1.p1 TRINITY_DN1600_c0_g1~~TRINITY_DN1600_c0_g1_i1.p1  ORF type:complete len:346 (-),score=44.28 TRINITY_DN1600_c0_g1_i1:134-1171(-)
MCIRDRYMGYQIKAYFTKDTKEHQIILESVAGKVTLPISDNDGLHMVLLYKDNVKFSTDNEYKGFLRTYSVTYKASLELMKAEIESWKVLGYPRVSRVNESDQSISKMNPYYEQETLSNEAFQGCGTYGFNQGENFVIYYKYSSDTCALQVTYYDAVMFDITSPRGEDVFKQNGLNSYGAIIITGQFELTRVQLAEIKYHWKGSNQTHEISQFAIVYLNGVLPSQLQELREALQVYKLKETIPLTNVQVLSKPRTLQQLEELQAKNPEVYIPKNDSKKDPTDPKDKDRHKTDTFDGYGNIFHYILIFIGVSVIGFFVVMGIFYYRKRQQTRREPIQTGGNTYLSM